MKTPPGTEFLHHATLFLGEREDLLKKSIFFIETRTGKKVLGNPDVSIERYETMGIDDARVLKERASTKPLGKERFFIISFGFMTVEAQNALLKLFEEPGENVYFFLITQSAAGLLPTLRSRLMLSGESRRKDMKEIVSFLASSVDGRLKAMERFKGADNESKKSEFLDFIDAIEQALGERLPDKKAGEALREVLALKRYAYDRAPSIKMLAEYLALKLPTLK